MNSADDRLSNQGTSTEVFLSQLVEASWDEEAKEVALEKEQRDRNRIKRFAWA